MFFRSFYDSLAEAWTSSNVTRILSATLAVVLTYFVYNKRQTPKEMKMPHEQQQQQQLQVYKPKVKEKKGKSFQPEDYTPYIEEEIKRTDLKLLPAQQNLISRVKLARQKAINSRIQQTLTESDKKKEKIIEGQQLAKIYSLLNENSDKFGSCSFDDVRQQMSMYRSGHHS